MKHWSRERWRKLYLREALEQRGRWPVMARGLRDYLLRHADDDGALVRVRDGEEPAVSLVASLGAHDDEAALVLEAARKLLADGYLTVRDGHVCIENLEKAQSPAPLEPADFDEMAPAERKRTKAAERQRRKREREREERDGERDTPRDRGRDGQRDSHAPSPPLPLSLREIEKTEKPEERERETRAPARGFERDGTPEKRDDRRDDPSRVTSVTASRSDGTERPWGLDEDRETVCPLNLVERADSVGLVAELAAKLNEPEPVIRDCLREFVEYWTIGEGIGKRRPHWMRKAREHVRRAKGAGRLKPIGALEHEAATSAISPEHAAKVISRGRARIAAIKGNGPALAFGGTREAGSGVRARGGRS